VLKQPQPWLLDPEWTEARRKALADAVRTFHREKPLLPGIAKQELRSSLLPDSPPFLIDALLAGLKDLVIEGETVRLRSHKLVLKEDEQNARAAIEKAFEQSGLAAPAVGDVLAKAGVEAARARTLLEILVREKRLVRVSQELVLHDSALGALRSVMTAKRGTRFTVADFKDWTGVSRKYAIPILEFLDRERVTRREGDQRLVL
jgi:selenocysteine-specific elongation factor